MILLQSKDIFEDILQIDPLSGRTEGLKRWSSPEIFEASISGSFSDIGGHRLLFFRFGGRLKFMMNGKEVEIDDETGV